MIEPTRLPGTEGGLTPPPHLSPSSIGTFQQCPLKFKYNKIDKILDGPTEATVMGNFVHDVFEELYKLPAVDRTIESARVLMRSAWDNKWGEEAFAVVPQDNIHKFRWKSWWCVENYFNMEDPKTVEPEGLETKVEGMIGDQKVLGFIDRWGMKEDGSVVISDYKTGKVPAPKWRGDKFFQLLVYSKLLSEMLDGKKVSDLELLYVNGGVTLKESATKANVAQMEATVTKVSLAIRDRCESGVFEYKPSRLCDWCSYKSFCPAWQN